MKIDRAADWEEAMELDLLWVALGRLVIQGKVSLRVARMACAILIVVASYRRNGENKPEVAAGLRSSRRVIRELLGRHGLELVTAYMGHIQDNAAELTANAIEALPDRYRPVVVLRYGQQMSVKDIGRSLGLPVGTVVSQIFRANRILRTKLKHLVGK